MGCGISKKNLPADDDEQEFQLFLWRRFTKEALGLSLVDEADGTLSVEGISKRGLVSDFMRANPEEVEKRVHVGYTIAAVNDVSGECQAMRQELDDNIVVQLTVRRTAICHSFRTPVTEIAHSVQGVAQSAPAGATKAAATSVETSDFKQTEDIREVPTSRGNGLPCGPAAPEVPAQPQKGSILPDVVAEAVLAATTPLPPGFVEQMLDVLSDGKAETLFKYRLPNGDVIDLTDGNIGLFREKLAKRQCSS
eukprot:TRINITY_DN6211_c0_g1_i4.p1 TRINITY_DN6211_c0_g1~~TRINITY_DN6211_c0_g1_i4.p1  ORF type:complete len:251 (-),score=48.80 TRINITY_DN6211_c0_g1_i4:941-1693(-)